MSTVEAPFQLERVLFVRCIVVAIAEFNEATAAADLLQPTNEINVQRDTDKPLHFLCSMRTTINPEKSAQHPYFIDMECVCGLEQMDQGMSDATAHRGATITAHSVLYGAIRETIAWLTARQPWGTFPLGLSMLQPGTLPPPGAPTTPPAP